MEGCLGAGWSVTAVNLAETARPEARLDSQAENWPAAHAGVNDGKEADEPDRSRSPLAQQDEPNQQQDWRSPSTSAAQGPMNRPVRAPRSASHVDRGGTAGYSAALCSSTGQGRTPTARRHSFAHAQRVPPDAAGSEGSARDGLITAVRLPAAGQQEQSGESPAAKQIRGQQGAAEAGSPAQPQARMPSPLAGPLVRPVGPGQSDGDTHVSGHRGTPAKSGPGQHASTTAEAEGPTGDAQRSPAQHQRAPVPSSKPAQADVSPPAAQEPASDAMQQRPGQGDLDSMGERVQHLEAAVQLCHQLHSRQRWQELGNVLAGEASLLKPRHGLDSPAMILTAGCSWPW